MSEILVIGEPEIIEGFALTGARIRPEGDPARMERILENYMRSRDVDIVVVTESLFVQAPEKTRVLAEKSGRPIFLTLPRPAGIEAWGEREDLISQIIRRAIGYRLKIRR
jgi:vacuolar-type H+-ATPase subunit F/Vma7